MTEIISQFEHQTFARRDAALRSSACRGSQQQVEACCDGGFWVLGRRTAGGPSAGRPSAGGPSAGGRCGVTLVELLVVIGISVSVLAIAIPIVRLTTADNRISVATQTVRSFLDGAVLEAQSAGRSSIIFERNFNNPNLCTRIFRGRPRPNYRGEDSSAYAIKAPSEFVEIDVIRGGTAQSVVIGFDVFYLYNADFKKVVPFEYLQLDDRPEQFLIYRSFEITSGPTSSGGGILRPVVKVFCRLDPIVMSDPLAASRTSHLAVPTGPEFTAVSSLSSPINGWVLAGAPPLAGGVLMDFWPAEPAYRALPGYNGSTSIPRWSVAGGTTTLVSRISGFQTSQPPALSELDFLELPDGVAIHLDGSGFGEIDGVADGFIPHAQFMHVGMLRAESAEANLPNQIDIDLNLAQQDTYPGRTAYFPRIEMDSEGRVFRAFAMSPRMTSLTSYVDGAGPQLTRSAPFTPVSQLALLVGEIDAIGRPALAEPMDPALAAMGLQYTGILNSDHWIVMSNQTRNTKILKAEDNVTIALSREVTANASSEK